MFPAAQNLHFLGHPLLISRSVMFENSVFGVVMQEDAGWESRQDICLCCIFSGKPFAGDMLCITPVSLYAVVYAEGM